MPNDEPAFDLVRYVRGLSDAELRAYGEEFGEGSREYMLMQQEQARRRSRSIPLWARILPWLIVAGVLVYWFLR